MWSKGKKKTKQKTNKQQKNQDQTAVCTLIFRKACVLRMFVFKTSVGIL